MDDKIEKLVLWLYKQLLIIIYLKLILNENLMVFFIWQAYQFPYTEVAKSLYRPKSELLTTKDSVCF